MNTNHNQRSWSIIFFIKQQFAKSTYNDYNKYHKKYYHYNIARRNYLLRKNTKRFLNTYFKRSSYYEPYTYHPIANMMYLYYLNKYQGIINNPIHHYTFNDYLPNKSGVIVENIISSDYFKLTDQNAMYVSLWYLKGFEKITKKRWSAHSYLHNNYNQKTHLHFLLEPFRNFRIHKDIITNPNNAHLVINTQQLNELKTEFNTMFSTPEYDALLNELIELDDNIKNMITRDHHYRSILSFMKSKEMYSDFDNNINKILNLDLSHINEEQILSLTQNKEVSDFKQKI